MNTLSLLVISHLPPALTLFITVEIQEQMLHNKVIPPKKKKNKAKNSKNKFSTVKIKILD